jgi:membrane protease YdiL (CAAX protease family)
MAPSIARKFRRLSPAARIGLWLGGTVAASALWCLVLLVVLRPGLEAFREPARFPMAHNAYLVGTYLLLLGGAMWTWRHLQGESLRALGIGWDAAAPGRVALGAAVGLGSLGALLGLEAATGLLGWNAANWAATPGTAIAATAATALFFAASEELLFRGFVLQTLRRGFDTPVAMAGSAWLYALVHFLRFDLVWHQVVLPFTGLFCAGLLLAWAALRTRTIWLSVGLHAGWVALFLLADRFHLFDYRVETNALTGGGYPLGGPLGIALVLLVWAGLAAAWRDRRP